VARSFRAFVGGLESPIADAPRAVRIAPEPPPLPPEARRCLIVGSTRCSEEKDAVEVCTARKEWEPALECVKTGRECVATKPQCSIGTACCWSTEHGERYAPSIGSATPLPPEERVPLSKPPPAPTPAPEPPPRKVAIPGAAPK
jgi:hypothetical protein